MKITRYFLLCIATCSLLLGTNAAQAAIQYGGTTQQASFAASTTQSVSGLLNSIAPGSNDDSSTINAPGILAGIGRFFVGINTWLKEKAGIDLFAIIRGIGGFFLVIIRVAIELLKKLL